MPSTLRRSNRDKKLARVRSPFHVQPSFFTQFFFVTFVFYRFFCTVGKKRRARKKGKSLIIFKFFFPRFNISRPWHSTAWRLITRVEEELIANTVETWFAFCRWECFDASSKRILDAKRDLEHKRKVKDLSPGYFDRTLFQRELKEKIIKNKNFQFKIKFSMQNFKLKRFKFWNSNISGRVFCRIFILWKYFNFLLNNWVVKSCLKMIDEKSLSLKEGGRIATGKVRVLIDRRVELNLHWASKMGGVRGVSMTV